MEKLTDNEFFNLKKGDFVIEDFGDGEFRILMEVIGVIAGQKVAFKRIKFYSTGDFSEDAENNELLSTFPSKIIVSRDDVGATLFSGCYVVEPHETPVTNSLVAYFKTTMEDYLMEHI